jgi:hypothetical protein
MFLQIKYLEGNIFNEFSDIVEANRSMTNFTPMVCIDYHPLNLGYALRIMKSSLFFIYREPILCKIIMNNQ